MTVRYYSLLNLPHWRKTSGDIGFGGFKQVIKCSSDKTDLHNTKFYNAYQLPVHHVLCNLMLYCLSCILSRIYIMQIYICIYIYIYVYIYIYIYIYMS